MTTSGLATPVAPRTLGRTIRAYVALTKPRVLELLLVTTVPVMILAEGGFPSLWLVLATVIGGSMSAGSAAAFNMYLDRDIDAHMQRTVNRPLVTGEVSPRGALIFAWTLAVASTLWLWATTNWLAATLSASAIFFYVVIYTMILKRRTEQNIVWGGIAGCFPVVIGWTAVTGSLAWAPVILFALVFLWTPPHYWPLSMKYKEQYDGVDVPMLGATRSGSQVGPAGHPLRVGDRGVLAAARSGGSDGCRLHGFGPRLRRLVHLRVAPALQPRRARHGAGADARVPRLDHVPDAALRRDRDRPAAAVLAARGSALAAGPAPAAPSPRRRSPAARPRRPAPGSGPPRRACSTAPRSASSIERRSRSFDSSCGIEASGPYVSSVSPRKPASERSSSTTRGSSSGVAVFVEALDARLPRLGHQHPALGELLHEARPRQAQAPDDPGQGEAAEQARDHDDERQELQVLARRRLGRQQEDRREGDDAANPRGGDGDAVAPRPAPLAHAPRPVPVQQPSCRAPRRSATRRARAACPAQMNTVCQTPGPVRSAPARMPFRFSPMKRKTAFSSRNWIVRQFSRSATRASAEETTGARKPRYRPVTTTASTPDPCSSSAIRNAANGVMSERLVSSTAERSRAPHERDQEADGESDRDADDHRDDEVERDRRRASRR